MSWNLSRTLVLLAVWGSLGLSAPAQRATGSVVGQVKDSEGTLIPTVTVTLASGSWVANRVTDEKGYYRIDDVPPGTYTAWFNLTGFKNTARQGIAVDGIIQSKVDALMQVSDYGADLSNPPRPHIRVETSLGSFTLVLYSEQAPITVANFLKYVDKGFYNKGRVHRATRADNYVVNLPNRPLLEVVQAGIDPEKKVRAFPSIPLERTSITGLKHVVGTVSMARGAAADTATSDFFVVLNDQPSLDYGGKRFDDEQGAAAFGHIASGMDVLRKIQAQPTTGQNLTPPITIISAKRVTPER